jgi:hypothetical protein
MGGLGRPVTFGAQSRPPAVRRFRPLNLFGNFRLVSTSPGTQRGCCGDDGWVLQRSCAIRSHLVILRALHGVGSRVWRLSAAVGLVGRYGVVEPHAGGRDVVLDLRMGWSLDTPARRRSAAVQQRPDRLRERDDGEGLIQKAPLKTQLHLIVIDLLRAVCGHQKDLYFWAEGLHFCRELQPVHEGHDHIRQEKMDGLGVGADKRECKT